MFTISPQGSKGYGAKIPNCKFTEEDFECIYDLSVFDKDNLEEHTYKLLVVFGSRVGFRGQKEHYKLEKHQIGTGFFPDSHAVWPGLEWWGVVNWGNLKTHML